jgi:hypothetical protein
MYEHIGNNVRRLIAEIPTHVGIVAAAKTRSPDEIAAALDAGVSFIGENYIQETETAKTATHGRGCWHFIGHLQLNKVKKAVELFDVIETVDSLVLAESINRHAAVLGKIVPVLIEVNIACETQKSGVPPQSLALLAEAISRLPCVRLSGLMTMGPRLGAEELRPFFRQTRHLYEELKQADFNGVAMEYLSMGMSDSYRVAIEEGANLIRLGSAIFGPRS